MFNFFKRNKEFSIKAPMDGKVIPINEVNDEAFSQKMLGEGVAIIPDNGNVVSPVDGEVIQVFDTLHAYGIRSNEGIEILIHIGINTVELKGEGFKSFVSDGRKVNVGDKLAEVNLDLLKEKNYLLDTPIVITNLDKIKNVHLNTGIAKSAQTIIISYNK